MKSMKLMAQIYAQQARNTCYNKGLRDEETLALIEAVANKSFYDGAKASMDMISSMMNEISANMEKED